MVCYDDRFIVKLAYESDGVVVSNDTYRDLQGERQEWKRFIEERLLMYSFVNDKYVTAGGLGEMLGSGGGGGGGPCGPIAHCLGSDVSNGEEAGASRAFDGGLGVEASLRQSQCIPRWLSPVSLW